MSILLEGERRTREQAFVEKYGEDFRLYGGAYNKRTPGGVEFTERDVPKKWVYVDSENWTVAIEVVRKRFAKAIVEGLAKQPEENRVQWLIEGLAEIDVLRPPRGND